MIIEKIIELENIKNHIQNLKNNKLTKQELKQANNIFSDEIKNEIENEIYLILKGV